MTATFRAIEIVRIGWSAWNDVCGLHPLLISRENPGMDVDYYHTREKDTNSNPSYISVKIPPQLSALNVSGVAVEQTALHGDWLVLLNSGKILVVPGVEGMTLTGSEGNFLELTMDSSFILNKEDFPLYRRWRHRNGKIYVITGYSNTSVPTRPKYPPMIEYANYYTGTKYSRRADDWHRSMTLISD